LKNGDLFAQKPSVSGELCPLIPFCGRRRPLTRAITGAFTLDPTGASPRPHLAYTKKHKKTKVGACAEHLLFVWFVVDSDNAMHCKALQLSNVNITNFVRLSLALCGYSGYMFIRTSIRDILCHMF